MFQYLGGEDKILWDRFCRLCECVCVYGIREMENWKMKAKGEEEKLQKIVQRITHYICQNCCHRLGCTRLNCLHLMKLQNFHLDKNFARVSWNMACMRREDFKYDFVKFRFNMSIIIDSKLNLNGNINYRYLVVQFIINEMTSVLNQYFRVQDAIMQT